MDMFSIFKQQKMGLCQKKNVWIYHTVVFMRNMMTNGFFRL